MLLQHVLIGGQELGPQTVFSAPAVEPAAHVGVAPMVLVHTPVVLLQQGKYESAVVFTSIVYEPPAGALAPPQVLMRMRYDWPPTNNRRSEAFVPVHSDPPSSLQPMMFEAVEIPAQVTPAAKTETTVSCPLVALPAFEPHVEIEYTALEAGETTNHTSFCWLVWHVTAPSMVVGVWLKLFPANGVPTVRTEAVAQVGLVGAAGPQLVVSLVVVLQVVPAAPTTPGAAHAHAATLVQLELGKQQRPGWTHGLLGRQVVLSPTYRVVVVLGHPVGVLRLHVPLGAQQAPSVTPGLTTIWYAPRDALVAA